MNVMITDWSTHTERFSSLFSIFFMLLGYLIPTMILIFIVLNRNYLHTDGFKQKYGGLINQIKTKRFIYYLNPVFFTYRRIFFVWIVVFMKDSPES